MASLADATPPIALGALDGRYRGVVAPLVDHLSEPALNRERVRVEVEWLIFLTTHQVVPGVRALADDEQQQLRQVVEDFGADEIAELAQIEAETQHDVKAVEYFLKRRLTAIAPGEEDRGLAELIHFCCTSEDINNLSYALMVKGAVTDVWLPRATGLVESVATMASDLRDVPLLAHTHGQPATPTTMGKELAVLAHRLGRQLRRIGGAEFLGKLNGATGTYGAHLAAVPDADWPTLSREFVESLGLQWNPLTTQIESHDWQAELYADIARFNRILHNLCTDVWTYISLGYFAQVRGQGTVGSSTMPHKVNPIRFENAEANLEVSNALFDVLSSTLVNSRLQRDLTDSSMQRNIGVAFGHSLLAIDNAARGLAGLDAVPSAMAADLDANWEVLGEADPVRDARPRRPGRRRHGEPLRAAQGAHPRPSHHRRRPARVRGRAGVARRRGQAPGGDDPPELHRRSSRAGRLPRLSRMPRGGLRMVALGWTVLALVFLDAARRAAAAVWGNHVSGVMLATDGAPRGRRVVTFASPKAPRGMPAVRPVTKVLVFGLAGLRCGRPGTTAGRGVPRLLRLRERPGPAAADPGARPGVLGERPSGCLIVGRQGTAHREEANVAAMAARKARLSDIDAIALALPEVEAAEVITDAWGARPPKLLGKEFLCSSRTFR